MYILFSSSFAAPVPFTVTRALTTKTHFGDAARAHSGRSAARQGPASAGQRTCARARRPVALLALYTGPHSATAACQCAMGCYTARLVLANCSCPLREGRYIEGPCTEGRWHLPRGLGCSLTRRPSFPKKSWVSGSRRKLSTKKLDPTLPWTGPCHCKL